MGFLVKDGIWRKGEGETGLAFGLNGIFQFDSTIMGVFLLGFRKKEEKFKSEVSLMNWNKVDVETK